ncbi:MAG: ABC transporter permease [Planctomycetota bacterium]
MRKIWTIAKREFGAMVATKAFLFSLTLMPVLMFGGILAMNLLKDVRDVSDKTIVIVDGTGGLLFDDMQQAADARNAGLKPSEDAEQTAPRYLLERYASDEASDEQRLELSDRVRSDEIAAFVEIPADALALSGPPGQSKAKFFAQNSVLSEQRGWVENQLNAAATARRLAELNLDAEAVGKATARIPLAPLGLVKQESDGAIRGPDEEQGAAGIFIPFGFMMLMFMVIMLSAQPMLESVLEEKGQRIAEVLLGSANPFQLMLGKLMGNVAGSLSIVTIYGLGIYATATYMEWIDMLPLETAPWFLVYQIFAVLLFGSLFLAVGAAVNQLKEAQSMLLPAWLLLASPLFVWLQIVREPNGAIATGLSFFPPAIPMVMTLRLASEATIPAWQIAAGLLLLSATTLACVYLAGRVFRVGILWQGKTPRVGELLRWMWSG